MRKNNREYTTEFTAIIWCEEIQDEISVTIEFEVIAQPNGKPSKIDSFAEGHDMEPSFVGFVCDLSKVEFSDKEKLQEILSSQKYEDIFKEEVKDFYYETANLEDQGSEYW